MKRWTRWPRNSATSSANPELAFISLRMAPLFNNTKWCLISIWLQATRFISSMTEPDFILRFIIHSLKSVEPRMPYQFLNGNALVHIHLQQSLDKVPCRPRFSSNKFISPFLYLLVQLHFRVRNKRISALA